jgi:hypothetical protein
VYPPKEREVAGSNPAQSTNSFRQQCSAPDKGDNKMLLIAGKHTDVNAIVTDFINR